MNDHLPIGHDWLEVVRAPTLSLFASHFHNEATLEGAVVNGTLIGGRAIYAFFSATRQMYDTISFTEETHGKRTVYLEWEGLYRGKPVNGVTSITRKDGLINRVTVNHRPLAQAEAFAHELASHIRHAISRP